ncbi:hypothetical protein WL045_08575 [Vibrio alginolyticus]|uniref:hypothetical protein n=1 Tax=Vibrio alginolyticus TaxID=663 RepID=UPI003754BD83
MKRLFALTLATTALAGCTSTANFTKTAPSRIESIDSRSYEVGVETKAYVGEEILTRKAYKTLVEPNAYQAKQEFFLSGGLSSVAVRLDGKKGDIYEIVGSNEKGNDLVMIPGSHLMFGIDNKGHWDNTVVSGSYWTSPVGSGSQYAMEPANAMFEKHDKRTPLEEYGYVNHELIFTGLSESGINVLYREYTFNNHARSAFTQELIYPKSTKTIRFRNYQLSIDSVTSESIVYTITND